MKKYLIMFMAFCLVVLAVPDIHKMLPAGLRSAGPDIPIRSKERRYAVECICEGEQITMPLEEYVCRVLMQEGYAGLPSEALKALACVVRTRVLAGNAMPLNSSSAALLPDAEAAAAATENLYIAYGGEPIDAKTHASSRGRTASAGEAYGEEIPYLKSVETPEDAPVSEKRFTAAEMARILNANGFQCDATLRLNSWLTYVSRSASGRIRAVWLCGNQIGGAELARMLGFDSADMEISTVDGGFEIRCFGSGDGVGLSVLGACAMAESGASFNEILLHFFAGTDIMLNNDR